MDQFRKVMHFCNINWKPCRPLQNDQICLCTCAIHTGLSLLSSQQFHFAVHYMVVFSWTSHILLCIQTWKIWLNSSMNKEIIWWFLGDIERKLPRVVTRTQLDQSQGQSRVGNPKPSKHSVPHKSTLRYYFQSSPSPRVQRSLAAAAGAAEPGRQGEGVGGPPDFGRIQSKILFHQKTFTVGRK